MDDIKLLIEDYKRRLMEVNKLFFFETNHRYNNEATIECLTTKASCYRTFINELERIKL
jgi:hypothetical protein